MNITRTKFVEPVKRLSMKRPVIIVQEDDPEQSEEKKVITPDPIPEPVREVSSHNLRRLEFTISKSTASLYQPEMDTSLIDTSFDLGDDIVCPYCSLDWIDGAFPGEVDPVMPDLSSDLF